MNPTIGQDVGARRISSIETPPFPLMSAMGQRAKCVDAECDGNNRDPSLMLTWPLVSQPPAQGNGP
jgi:hypothetical protein